MQHRIGIGFNLPTVLLVICLPADGFELVSRHLMVALGGTSSKREPAPLERGKLGAMKNFEEVLQGSLQFGVGPADLPCSERSGK